MGLNVREALEIRGLSENAFSKHIGVNQSTVHRIATNAVDIEYVELGTAIRIARGLGITVEQLYYGDEVRDAQKYELTHIYDGVSTLGQNALLAAARGIYAAYSEAIPSLNDSLLG